MSNPAEGGLPNGLAFFGGQIASGTPGGTHGQVSLYDSKTSSLRSEANLGVPRSLLSCTSSTAHSVIVCAGGQDKSKSVDIAQRATDVFTVSADGNMTVVSSGQLKEGRKKLSGGAAGDLVAFGMGYRDVPKEALKENMGDTGGYSDAVDVYNVTDKTWSSSTLPSSSIDHRADAKRMYGTAVGCGGYIIFAGGQIGGGRSAAVDVLNGNTGAWMPSVGNLTVARSGLSSACASDRFALFAGGQIPLRDEVDVLDTKTMKWLPLQHLNTPRSFLAGAGNGNCALFAGGNKIPAGAHDTDVFCFDGD